jgi:hypothetical protein
MKVEQSIYNKIFNQELRSYIPSPIFLLYLEFFTLCKISLYLPLINNPSSNILTSLIPLAHVTEIFILLVPKFILYIC